MTRPQRVLFILNSADGGATQGIIELLRGLPANLYEPYLVLPHQPSESQAALFSELAQGTFVVPMTWWNKKTAGPFLFRALEWVRGALRTWGRVKPTLTLRHLIRSQHIDIVYTNTALMLEGALAAKLCGVPHLWHIKEGIGKQGRVKFWLPDWLLTRFIASMSTKVLVMTRFIGNIFERNHLGGNITLLYDGVNLEEYSGDLKGAVLRTEIGVTDDQILIGMVASLSSIWKEHIVFIEIAAQLASQHPNVRFAIFGPQPNKMKNPAYNKPWNYYQDLKKRVELLGLEDRLIWAGFRPNIPQMMAALDILIHPCQIEPFGRISIEAMAARRPVIGPSSGGIAESVVNGHTGYLVSPGDPKAFAEAATRLIQDTTLRHDFGNNGYNHVASNFSIQQHVENVSILFNTITTTPS